MPPLGKFNSARDLCTTHGDRHSFSYYRRPHSILASSRSSTRKPADAGIVSQLPATFFGSVVLGHSEIDAKYTKTPDSHTVRLISSLKKTSVFTEICYGQGVGRVQAWLILAALYIHDRFCANSKTISKIIYFFSHFQFLRPSAFQVVSS